jgi:hypothetical protein
MESMENLAVEGRLSAESSPVMDFLVKPILIWSCVWQKNASAAWQKKMQMPSLECNDQSHTPSVGQVSLSINTQFWYFVMVDGREKLPYCKVLMNTLVLWLCIVFEISCLMTSQLSYSLLFPSDTERVHDWLIHLNYCDCIMMKVWL